MFYDVTYVEILYCRVHKTDGTLSDHWESFAKPGENFHEEIVVKEESMMLEEFQRRKEHDRVQVELDP